MALKSYKISEAIKVIYQAAGATTGLTVNMQVYDELGAAFTTAPTPMAEISTTGRYSAQFTPDAQGEWFTQISDAGGGKAIKQFSVGGYNVDSVGGLVGTVNTNVGTVDTKVVAVQTAVDSTKTQVIATLTAVQGIDIQLDTVEANISAVNVKIDALESPPMIG